MLIGETCFKSINSNFAEMTFHLNLGKTSSFNICASSSNFEDFIILDRSQT